MNKLNITILALATVSLTSCTRYYYKPNAVNAPLFTDGNQYRLGFGGSLGDGDGAGNTSFFDFQAAVSPVKYLGIIGNFSTFRYRPDNPSSSPTSGNVNASANLGELGIGGYYPVGNRKAKFVVDMYAGGGIGSMQSDVNMDVRKIFIQPGFGLATPWVDVGFNFRVNNVKYSNLDVNGRNTQYLLDHYLINEYGGTINNSNYTFFEPAITLRAGYKFAKVQFQGAFATPMSNVPWHYNGARFTVGFYMSIEGIIEAARQGGKD